MLFFPFFLMVNVWRGLGKDPVIREIKLMAPEWGSSWWI